MYFWITTFKIYIYISVVDWFWVKIDDGGELLDGFWQKVIMLESDWIEIKGV